jgi:hypothetical protein
MLVIDNTKRLLRPESHNVFVIETHAVKHVTKVLKKEMKMAIGGIKFESRNLGTLRGIGQATVRRSRCSHGGIAAAELVRHRWATEELHSTGACQCPKVGLAEVRVAHVDRMKKIADD